MDVLCGGIPADEIFSMTGLHFRQQQGIEQPVEYSLTGHGFNFCRIDRKLAGNGVKNNHLL